jgi:hypothetical protein
MSAPINAIDSGGVASAPFVKFSDKLTGSIGSLHALTIKYARIANEILDVLPPIVKGTRRATSSGDQDIGFFYTEVNLSQTAEVNQ